MIKHVTVNGVPLNQLCVRDLYNQSWFSQEFWQLDSDLFGPTPLKSILLNMNLYEYIRNMVYHIIAATTPGPDFSMINALSFHHKMSNHLPYFTVFQMMLNEVQAKGARLYLNMELVSVERGNGGSAHPKYELSFASGDTISTRMVILNLPSMALNKLSSDSVIFTEATPSVLESLRAPLNNLIDLSKTYLYYSDAWWLRHGLDRGRYVSTEPHIGELRYHDGQVECPSYGHCRGVLQASFTFREKTDANRNFALQSPLNVFRPTDPMGQMFLDRVSSAVKSLHPDLNDIPDPDFAVVSNWPRNGGAPGPLAVTPNGQYSSNVLRPLPNDNIFICNVDYGQLAGFAEGSLRMAEKIVGRYFGQIGFPSQQYSIAAPSWLVDATSPYESYPRTWYYANVLVDN
jgi:hypothetical protein